MLPRYITDERTGLKYELTGDYFFIARDNDPEVPGWRVERLV